MQQSSETLAGRIAYLELTPFLINETGPAEQLWSRGGFPDSFLAPDDQGSYEWRAAFVHTYLDRYIPITAARIPAATLRRFWEMLAHDQGQPLNAARLAASLGVSGQTIARYLQIAASRLLVRRLLPWSNNAGKRLVHSPKSLRARQRPRPCTSTHPRQGRTPWPPHRGRQLGRLHYRKHPIHNAGGH